MATVSSLNNYSFAFNGFVFGGTGSPYQITKVDGLESLPTIRNQDDNSLTLAFAEMSLPLLPNTLTAISHLLGNSSAQTLATTTILSSQPLLPLPQQRVVLILVSTLLLTVVAHLVLAPRLTMLVGLLLIQLSLLRVQSLTQLSEM